MKRIAILTSGGDSPGMNAAVRSIVRTAIHYDIEVYGIKRGYQGLIEGDLIKMDTRSVSDILDRGGTMLLTARSEAFMTEEGFGRALDVLKEYSIDGLVVIGGNGSMRGAKDLSDSGVAAIGIPGTIDNDLPYTDFTIGFDTAVNTAINAIGNLRDTSSSHGRVTIVQLMGRHCGDIALFAGIGSGADVIIVPEDEYDEDEVCRRVLEGKKRGKLHCLIIAAEGAPVTCEELKTVIMEKTGMESRITVLGHVQRGGSPSSYDRLIASRMGAYAVKVLMEGRKARAVGIKNEQMIDLDITEALEIRREKRLELIELGDILAE
ncbi:MAG: 6-phosphofructokinase [Clostridiales bacterium]|nr:6-phosphofructokinase [Clostridiales bacterium]MBR6700503.1 6-phosphofructokinase [Bacillota bacterium]